MELTRRDLFKGAAAAAGASVVSRTAEASPAEKTTVVIVNLPGGLHSLGAQADTFVSGNHFGCSGTNTREVGNGIVVDNATFGMLDSSSFARMCNLGVWHGISAHAVVQNALMVDALSKSYPLQLARAMGGTGPVACARLGPLLAGRHEPIGPASMQQVADAGGLLLALGASQPGEFIPERGLARAGLKASLKMSTPTLTKNQRSLSSVTSGLSGVVRALSAPPIQLDWPAIAAAYGLSPTTTLVSGLASQFATAELLVHAGTNVVLLSSHGPACTLGWDTHGDTSGQCTRSGFNELLIPSLRTFLSRMLSLPGHNVVTALIGDFTRQLDTEHAGMLVASAWGPHLKQGTTGAFNISGPYNSYSPKNGMRTGVPQLWSFLAAAAKVQGNPFGANPHPFT